MGLLPHALVVPYPAQGHVIPLLELAYCLVDCGFKITLVNTEFNHARVVAALSPEKESHLNQIRLVSVPDGLDPGEDRNGDLWRVMLQLMKAMPPCLEELITESNEPGEDKITCMIVDGSLAWALEVARKAGIRSAEFWPTAAAVAVTAMSTDKFIEDGVVDADGIRIKETFQLAPEMPPWSTALLAWTCFGDQETQKQLFHHIAENNRSRHIADIVICNSFLEIERLTFNYAPKILPIGPLLSGERPGKPVGHFWPEDESCNAWLDEQPINSVIYVAFGSFTTFEPRQFQELALGLELCNRPFLWVVRPGLAIDGAAQAFPQDFTERVGSRGRMVSWAHQQQVLAHPAVACFVSHCGWNSTLEGVRSGLRFLCWPYFADQFMNQSYICDVWRIGLKLVKDEYGIVSKEQMKAKVEEVLLDKEMRERARVLKEMARANMKEGGISFENLKRFVDVMTCN